MPKQIIVTLEGKPLECKAGTPIQQLLENHLPERRADALAVRVGSAVKGLRWQPRQDCECMLLTYADEEVRRQRLKESRDYSDHKISQMMSSQVSEEVFRAACDQIIDNSKDFTHTENQIAMLIETVTKKCRGRCDCS